MPDRERRRFVVGTCVLVASSVLYGVVGLHGSLGHRAGIVAVGIVVTPLLLWSYLFRVRHPDEDDS